MIGDIVRVAKDVCIPKGTVVSIKGVDADNRFTEKHLVGSATCLPINDEDRMTCGIWVEYLEPIPLTTYILEKNGFEKQLGNFVYENDDESLRIEFYPKNINYTNGCYDYIDIERGCITITEMPIEFVHELQHAMRLCGIDKEFEL